MIRSNRKNLRIATILADGRKFNRTLRTPPRQMFTPAGVDEVLKREAARVEEFFPGREFRLIPLRDGNFNCVEAKKDFTTEDTEGNREQ